MVDTSETQSKECTSNTSFYQVEKPCEGGNASVSLSTENETQFNFALDDIAGLKMTDEGFLLISFNDGGTLTVDNVSEAASNSEFQNIQLSDGEVINLQELAQGISADSVALVEPASGEALANLIAKPADELADATVVNYVAGESYITDFNKDDIEVSEVNEAGDLILTFVDETQTTITNFSEVQSSDEIPQVTLADGTVIDLQDLLSTAVVSIDEDGDKVAEVQSPSVQQIANIDPAAGDTASDLAAIEPAAGNTGTVPAGALGNTGANFGSSVTPIGLAAVNAIGPIAPTALQFDLPEFEDDDNLIAQTVNAPAPLQPPFIVVNNIFDYEDNNVNFGIFAQPSSASECVEVVVSGIPAGWTPLLSDPTTAAGIHNPGAGTWTIKMPIGQSLVTGPIFTPPLHSDGDIPTVTVDVAQKDLVTNVTTTSTQGIFSVTIDAVADPVTANATNVSGFEDNPVALNLSANLQDLDGSEVISQVLICDVPTGFSLNTGTDNGGGEWLINVTDLATLELSPLANYSGTVSLRMKVTNQETTFSGTEFDFTNNENTQILPFDVTFTPVVDAPSLVVNNPIVKEDGSVTLDISATLQDKDGSEHLVVMVENLDSTWTVATGANNGAYNSATGIWTITMPAGQDYSGSLTLTPPADSDVDMTNLDVTATSYESDGTNTSISTTVDVVTDAVIDTPTLTTSGVTGQSGTSYALSITNATTDTDNSETLGDVTISGVPAGFSLSAGTDNGGGVWTVTQAQLTGLQLNTPANFNGNFNLTVSVTATDNPTDTEVDFTDNTMTVTAPLNVNLQVGNANPPTVQIDGTHQVLEDGTVFVPFSAALSAGASATEVLTVELSGIDPTWTIATGSSNGTYNNGVWTITMPAGQNYSGGLTFTPPADSDIDMTGLQLKATATEPSNSSSETATAQSQVIVDAVADMPTLIVNNVTGLEGQTVNLGISASLTDLDNSELLSDITISDVPAGFSLSAGTDNGGGVWTVTQAQLTGLQLNTPANFSGSVPLTVSVTSTEQVTDTDFNLNNNVATNTKILNVVLGDTANPPVLNVDGTHQVLEDGSVLVPFSASITGDNSEVLTVSVSGIDPAWTITTGANNGTYNSATGVWTITMPAGQDYSGGLTFAPPADSDVDMTGLSVKASAFAPNTNTTSSVTELIQIITDAVADTPTIDAGADVSVVSGQSVALNITNATTDTDNSETLGDVTISGVPAGFSLSAGTDNGGGVWTVTQAQLTGLQLNTPANGNGTISLTVSVSSTESVTDDEFNLNNNVATNTDIVRVTVNPDDQPPSVTYGAGGSGSAQVLEDGSVYVPITATLNGNAPQELTVEVSGIPSSWTITTGANNGTYNNGVWTITMPAGQNYNGGLTFAPPADSDIDLTNLSVKATSRNTSTNQESSTTTSGEVIVDAVADVPAVNAGSDKTVDAGQSIKLDLSSSLNDNDGSETLSVRVSGVPSGYSLSTGTNLGGGVWELNPSQLNNVFLNTPASGNGTVSLTVTATATESPSDTEFNLNNNVATNTDIVRVTVNPDDQPPSVTYGAGGSGSAQVLEDGSVYVPITATLNGNAPQELTVEVSGIPSSWTITTGANNGTYNNGVWTITMPAGQNYNGGLTFAPPADSDIDLTNLSVKATSRNTSTNQESSTTTSGEVIVDAVADAPSLSVSGATGDQGSTIDLDINVALTDNDGSETLESITISGVPSGATLNNGSQVSSGVWEVPVNQLGNLKINTPGNLEGTYNLTVTATSTERVTDTDYIFTNNSADTVRNLTLIVNGRDDQPVVSTPGSILSKESDLGTPNVFNGQVTANFGGDGPGVFCVPSNGGFSASGAMSGGVLQFFNTPVTVTSSGNNTYVGKAGNTVVFELKVNANGSYTFKQFHTLDHQSPNNPNEIINLNFDIVAKDADGDTAVTTLTVRVQDTGPVANNDVVTMWTCDWVTIGNVITNYNQNNNGADQLSVEGTTVIHSVTSPFNETYGFSSGGDVMAVAGNYGYFYIYKDGSYAYVSWQTNPNSSHQETLSYKIIDSDGDISQATLTMNVQHATVSPNHAADYNGLEQTNTVISGRAAYKTNKTGGAMVFGDDDNDVLSGNVGDDIILGWKGDDILYGSGGDDILMGEHGSNDLAGGSGADLFSIHDDKENNAMHDTIWDFSMSEGDVISLEQVISGFGFNSDINDFVRVQRVGGDSMIQVNTDGQGGDFHNVALIKNETNLNAEDLFNKGHIDVY